MRLRDKVAIVTGGGAGIGRAISIRFATEGARVVLTDINPTTAAETVDAIGKAGGEAVALEGSVASHESNRHVVDETLKRFDQVDILINNAGLPSQYSEGTAHEIWDLGIELTLSSVFRMSDAVLPHMVERGVGAIVNICSIAGTKIGPGVHWYAAAKSGVTGLTRSQAAMYGPEGVRVNALCLGTITTQRTDFIRNREDRYQAFLQRTPLGRFGEPEEVANAALFLASDEASYLTGDVMTLDGGLTIQ